MTRREEPRSVSELPALLSRHPRFGIRGGETKPALAAAPPPAATLSLRHCSGIRRYHPLDFAITAGAGTPLAQIRGALRDRNQELAFEAVELDGSGTVGGCLATGIQGSSRLPLGGISSAVLGVECCDGQGRILRSGGPILRNTTGPNLARFLVGSLGRFAIVTEATLRTVPARPAEATVTWRCESLNRAASLLADLAVSRWDFDALDLEPESSTVLGRIRGLPEAIPDTARRLAEAFGQTAEVLDAEASARCWEARSRFAWAPAEWPLIRVLLPASALPSLDQACVAIEAHRTYSEAGRVAWVAHPAPATLESSLRAIGCPGLVVRDPSPHPKTPFLGNWTPPPGLRELKTLFDPHQKFPPLPGAESP